jgi:uncharacterized membrane protein
MIKIFIILFLIIALLVITWFCFVKNQTGLILKNKTDIETESFTVAEKNRVSSNLEKLYKQVNPANFYTQNFNTPNFTTDVLDLRKFYDYDLPASKSSSALTDKTSSGNDDGDMFRKAKEDNFPWLDGPDKNKNKNVMESDYWSYKEELPMNGGSFDGLVGYQNMGGAFAFFDQYKPVVETHPKITDDLRSGMGTPQKEKYLYDMSQI